MLRSSFRKTSIFGLLVLMILLVAGCGDLGLSDTPQEEPSEVAPAEEAPAEEPAVEKPAAGEPAAEEPTAEEQAGAEPVVEQPAAEEAAAEQPEISQPIYRWGEVADRLWVLVGYGDALNPTVVEEGIVITATFNSVDGQVSGSGGCNNYFASYESTDDGALTINGPIGATMMACPEGMEAETAYFSALETVTNWNLNEEGRLELTYDSSSNFEEKLVFAAGETPLTGSTWRLVSFGDPEELTELEEGTSVTIEFEPESETSGIAGGNASCNNYTTSYLLDGENISFGAIAGTMMICPTGMEQETAYLAALESAQTSQITGANLQITYDGGVLNYTSLNLPLENVLWQAVMVNGEDVPEWVEITALFVPGEGAGSGTVGGNAGCNNYNTSYERTDDLSTDPPTHYITIISPMAMTMMACPDESLAELEQSYLSTLESAVSYEIQGDEMILHSDVGDVIYKADREPLVGTLWTLVSWGSLNDPQPPAEGSAFTAQFDRLPVLPTGTVKGETGCNDYNATFAADLANIKINLPYKTNNEDCPWGEGNYEVEQQFFLGMNAATNYRIVGNTLQLIYGEEDSKQALNFVATPPEVEEGALDLTPLDDTFWYLASIGHIPILSGSEITAGFNINDDAVTGAISGSGGCNAYNAPISENFAIGPIATTAKTCAPALMDQEGTYFDWLATAYGYDRAGDQLLISTADGILTYHSQPILDQAHELQNTTWYMISYGAFEAIPGANPTVIFNSDGKTVSGTTGCNDYNGAYKTEQGNTLAISDISTTRAACRSDELTKQEETYLRLLPAATHYSVNGNQMQILTVDGQTINYSSIAPEAPQGPTAIINGPTLAEAGEQLSFDGSQSTAGSAPIVSYGWDMGDGAKLSGPTVQYTYNTPGSYTVTLTVWDSAGQSSTATQPVQISAVVEVTPPTAVIEGPSMASIGEPVTFSAANSQQGTAAITQYQWQSGDGNNSGSTAESSFTTIYSQPGTYYPAVMVADAGGLSDSASMSITINATLEGSSWFLGDTIPGTSITLNFGNGSLSGFAGCNNYNASYTTTLAAGNTNNISVGPISSSQALCPEDVMAQEQGYLASLQTASSYTINGDVLTLTTANGPLTFGAAVATPYAEPAVTQ